MKRLFALLCLFVLALPAARAADRLDGLLTLAPDDKAALAQIARTPDRHVLIYFGDYQH